MSATIAAPQRRALAAGAVGNFVEWFDYGVYGFLAVVISEVLFDDADPAAALLATFGVFALPVITRPIGGLVFARFGDRIGRKRVLAVVLLLMSVSTGCIGLIPSYATIGVAAPLLLIIARVVQGFSAGGEYAGGAALIAESAPANRRGFLVSFMPASTGLGLLAGSLVAFGLTSVLTDQQLHSWGWRVGFLLAFPLGVIGLYIRLRLEETIAFQTLVAKDEVSGSPLRETLGSYGGRVLKVAGIALGQTVCYYVVLVYTPTFLRTELDVPANHALLANCLAIAAYCVSILIAGHLSDRVGRKPLLIAGGVGMLVAIFPAYLIIPHSGVLVITILQVLVGGIALGCYTGPLVCSWAEMFPTRVRYSGVAAGFGLAVIVSVSSPFILTWLINKVGSDLMPAWYVGICVAISLLTLITVPETAPARAPGNQLIEAPDETDAAILSTSSQDQERR